jgi:hypothetical protein
MKIAGTLAYEAEIDEIAVHEQARSSPKTTTRPGDGWRSSRKMILRKPWRERDRYPGMAGKFVWAG